MGERTDELGMTVACESDGPGPVIMTDWLDDRELLTLLVEILPDAYLGDCASYVSTAWVLVDGLRDRRYGVTRVPELEEYRVGADKKGEGT